jgi:hypothetical protein
VGITEIQFFGRKGFLAVGWIAFAVYIASHVALSRVSTRLVQSTWAIQGTFLYIPTDPNIVAGSRRLQYLHLILRGFYFPVWQADHRLFGGPSPMWSMPLRAIIVTPNSAPQSNSVSPTN